MNAERKIFIVRNKFLADRKMIKAFIADDSMIIRKRLIAMLSKVEGVEITGQAQDVQEAIDSIQVSKPDLVILDIQMPGGSGIDVLKHIKKEQPSTIVIILTNYPYPAFRQACMDKGADFFFDKSREFKKVVEICRRLAQGSYV